MPSWSIRHPLIVLLAWCTLVAAGGVAVVRQITGARPAIDNSVAVWFMRDDPGLVSYRDFNRAFGEREWSLLLLTTDDILAPEFLQQLDALSDDLGRLPDVSKVVSLTTVRDSETGADDELAYTAVYRPHGSGRRATAEEVTAFAARIAATPMFHGSLFRPGDRQHTVLLIQNANRLDDAGPWRIALVDDVHRLAAACPGVRSHALAGTTVINAELNRASLRDVLVFYALVTALVALVAWFSLRSWRDVIVILAVVTACLLPTMGAISACGLAFNMVTVMLPTILIALSVADLMHFIHAIHCERAGERVAVVAPRCWRALRLPSTLTCLTTIVGFLMLAMSTVGPVFQLGVFTAVGLALAWLATYTLAPVALDALWGRRLAPALPPVLAGWLQRGTRRVRVPALAIVVLSLVAMAGLSRVHTDTDYSRFFRSWTGVARAYDDIAAAGFFQSPLALSVRFPAGSGWTDPAEFRRLVAFEAELRALPAVGKVLTATDLVERAWISLAGAEAARRQPLTALDRRQLDEVVFLGELSGNDDLRDFLTPDRQRCQVVALTAYLSSRALLALRSDIEALFARCFAGSPAQLDVTGTTVLWANMDSHITRTQTFSIAGMVLPLLVLFPIVARSLAVGLIAALVNLLPLACTFGLMGLCGVRINIATTLIGAIALGIVVDDTIHFLGRFRSERAAGRSWQDAIDATRLAIGASAVRTTAIVVGGFATMAVSSFRPTAEFGIFISYALLLGLAFDLYVLPAALALLAPRRDRARVAAPLVRTGAVHEST